MNYCCILTALILAMLSPAASADDNKQVRTCQKLKTAIERYTDLRRAGGSAEQMDAWKRARRKKKDRWDELDCRHLRARLK